MARLLTRLVGRVWARRCVGLLLAVCVIAAPAASEAAAEAVAAHDCVAASALVAGADMAPAPHQPDEDHEHHAHSCGACHLHLLNVRIAAPAGCTRAASAPPPHLADALVSAPTHGLFRPPRI